MLAVLAAVFFGLVVFDATFSRRRMRLFGLSVELNAAIKNTCALLGIELGVFVTMLLPAAALTYLCYRTHFQVGLALLIGFRARLSYIQIQSLKFEHQIREFRSKLAKENGLDLGPLKKDQTLPLGRSLPDKQVEAEAPPPIDKDTQC
jgi:hypothetical protein